MSAFFKLIQETSPELMRQAIKRLPPVDLRLSPDLIISAVARHYGLTTDHLIMPCRDHEQAKPRQETMWLLRVHTKLSFPAIGQRLNRDHTTVIHGIKAVCARVILDPDYCERVSELRAAVVYSSVPWTARLRAVKVMSESLQQAASA